MDPNATLREIRRILADTIAPGDSFLTAINLEDLTVNVKALDTWLSRGGILPNAWQDGILPDAWQD
jgi:hypothetical protein